MKNISKALEYLKKTEPRFGTLIDEFGEPDFELQDNYFKSLVRSIIYQQLSGKSAFAIYSRYLQLFNSTEFPSPQQVIAIPDSHYTSIGLSRQKTCYIKEISQAFFNKEIVPENIPKLKDDEVRKQFIKINNLRYGVSVGSGTDALCIALLGLGIDNNDEIIAVSNT